MMSHWLVMSIMTIVKPQLELYQVDIHTNLSPRVCIMKSRNDINLDRDSHTYINLNPIPNFFK